MGEAKWLAKVAKRHKEWIRIVNSFGEYDYAEDIVQQMYEVLYKYANESKIINNGVVSRGYVYFTLRSLFLQYCNAKNKVKKVRLDEQIGYHKVSTLIDKHIDKWRWYDKTLFKLYANSGMSIRKIAKETNISWVSIFNTLKKCKQEVKELFKEDWEDFKNNDYDRI